MNYQFLEQLTYIYNSLLLVKTKGEDTIIMAECLTKFHEYLLNAQKELQKKTNEEE